MHPSSRSSSVIRRIANTQGDEFSRRCSCRKHFRWTQNGSNTAARPGRARGRKRKRLSGSYKTNWPDAHRKQRPDDSTRTIQEAVTVFIQDKQVQGVSSGVLSRYKNELGRFQAYCERENVFTVPRITRELLTGYAATWEAQYPSSNTRVCVRERLRSFLRYCYECRWLDRIPAVPKVVADELPTLPLTEEEYERVLATIDSVKPRRFDAKGVTRLLSPETRKRLRALIQLMRWSGLAIQDAVKIRKASIIHDKAKKFIAWLRPDKRPGLMCLYLFRNEVAKEILSAPHQTRSTSSGHGKSESRAHVIRQCGEAGTSARV